MVIIAIRCKCFTSIKSEYEKKCEVMSTYQRAFDLAVAWLIYAGISSTKNKRITYNNLHLVTPLVLLDRNASRHEYKATKLQTYEHKENHKNLFTLSFMLVYFPSHLQINYFCDEITSRFIVQP